MKVVLLLGTLVALGLAVFEVTMSPSTSERLQLLTVFGVMAAVTAGLVYLLRPVASRFRSLRSTVVMVAMVTLAIAVAVALSTASLMFLTVHDLTLLFVVLAFGTMLGVVVATMLSKPLESDLGRLRRTAEQVKGGDLDARTGIGRPDELGEAAHAFDGMVAQLQANERTRREFLSAVGHDLRSPLAALRATVEALEDGVARDPDRYLRSMRADLDAMAHLVDDLELLATIEAGKVEVERVPVDLAELADESIEALAPVAAQHDVELRLEAGGRVAAVGGARELGRVIRNLVDNAIRHAPPGTEVVVRVSNGSAAEVRVCDAGPGFPADFVTSAFDSFVTGDAARTRHGGAGLGLAIARGFVSAHGGEIWAEPGPGGTVAFRLPSPG